jgi:shikimate kinase
MEILLSGVACVGKSSVGKRLAEDIGYVFFDLDVEIENYYKESISRLKAEFITEYSWRLKTAPVLKKILENNKSNDIVIALPPSGLQDAYFRVIKKFSALVVVLTDMPENILNRITFYDVDSKPISKVLDDKAKKYLLSEIKKDITYYKRFYNRAHFQFDISGLNVIQAASKLKELLGLEPTFKKAVSCALSIDPKTHLEPRLSYTNRKGKEYYLHVGKTKRGNPHYYFSTKDTGELAAKVPESYEIYEDPNASVFLLRVRLKLILDEETEIIKKELGKRGRDNDYKVNVRGSVITIFESNHRSQPSNDFTPLFSANFIQDIYERHATYIPTFRFILVDKEQRLFTAERFCFKGRGDDWMPLLSSRPDSLQTQVKRNLKHLGEETF